MKGKLIKGTGKGAKFMKLYADIFEEKLGFKPFPGTLNLELDKEPKLIKEKLILVEKEGYGAVDCYKTLIAKKYHGAIIVPHRTKLPANVVEIIAPIDLRKTLLVLDGDEIECE